jgi:RHS repeat-associated protein
MPLGAKSDEGGDVLTSRSLRRRPERKSRVVRAGCVYDYTPDLIYSYERDYEPAVGRYIESDPIGLFAGVNTYGYVSQDPLSWVDPMGLVEGSPGNLAKRRAIDRIGRGYARSTAWAFLKKKDDFGPNTNKCNKFVFDVLKEDA